jgi:hypothetical protein
MSRSVIPAVKSARTRKMCGSVPRTTATFFTELGAGAFHRPGASSVYAKFILYFAYNDTVTESQISECG